MALFDHVCEAPRVPTTRPACTWGRGWSQRRPRVVNDTLHQLVVG